METRNHETRVRLQGALTIAHSTEVKELLLAALSGTDDVLLDAAEVTEIDLTGLQLLCAAHRAALQAGATLTLDCSQSPCLTETLHKAGYIRHGGCVTDEKCLWAEASHG